MSTSKHKLPMSLRMSLREVEQRLETGPAGREFDDPRVRAALRLWLQSWIAPTIRATIAWSDPKDPAVPERDAREQDGSSPS